MRFAFALVDIQPSTDCNMNASDEDSVCNKSNTITEKASKEREKKHQRKNYTRKISSLSKMTRKGRKNNAPREKTNQILINGNEM